MGPLSPGESAPVTVMYVPRGTELGPLNVVQCWEGLVGDTRCRRREVVGADPLEIGRIARSEELLNAPLEYATTAAAASMNAAKGSICVRRLPLALGLNRAGRCLDVGVVPNSALVGFL